MKMSLIAGLDLRLVLLKRYFTQEKKENASIILFQNLFAVIYFFIFAVLSHYSL